MTRDIAEKFNLAYGDVLTIPELVVSSTAASILGLDGRKMSKSYNNVLPLFAGPDELAQADPPVQDRLHRGRRAEGPRDHGPVPDLPGDRRPG